LSVFIFFFARKAKLEVHKFECTVLSG